MVNKITITFGILAGILAVSWWIAKPSEKLKRGDFAPVVNFVNIHGAPVEISSAEPKLLHLQFRRFAGCPICNFHLQSYVKRNQEIAMAGIREVVFFHSSSESLLPYQGKFPFDVIGDPEKKIYSQFGVESSIFSILDVRAWPAMVRGQALDDRPKSNTDDGHLGLPADFLVGGDGKIIASHYGRHAYDQWSVDELLAFVKSQNGH